APLSIRPAYDGAGNVAVRAVSAKFFGASSRIAERAPLGLVLTVIVLMALLPSFVAAPGVLVSRGSLVGAALLRWAAAVLAEAGAQRPARGGADPRAAGGDPRRVGGQPRVLCAGGGVRSRQAAGDFFRLRDSRLVDSVWRRHHDGRGRADGAGAPARVLNVRA